MREALVSDYSTLLKRKNPRLGGYSYPRAVERLRGQVETYHGRLGRWSRHR